MSKSTNGKRIGILTAGGDCPGINAAIRGVGKTASGLAGGGDLILIPEIEYDDNVIAKYLHKRVKNKKPYSIVVVAEGIKTKKDTSAAAHTAGQIKEMTGMETRQIILGYIQRGGSPSPMDRILATRFGAKAVELIVREEYGHMVAKKGPDIVSVPLSEVEGKLRLVPPDYPLIKKARSMDVCFGRKNSQIA